MDDRSFDRIFHQAAAQVETYHADHDSERHKHKKIRKDEDELRRLEIEMTVDDAITRILLADNDKDYFRMLALPAPNIDALGRPDWKVSPLEISKAYRKLSILVHPDKNPGDDARQAFEALNKAHRMLKDTGELENILRDQLDKAKARKEEAEARATLEERVVLNARQLEEAKTLRKQESEALRSEIVRQIREKQERAKKRKEMEMASKYRRRRCDDDEEADGNPADDDGDKESTFQARSDDTDALEHSDDEDEDAEQRRRQALAKRRTQLRKKSGLL